MQNKSSLSPIATFQTHSHWLFFDSPIKLFGMEIRWHSVYFKAFKRESLLWSCEFLIDLIHFFFNHFVLWFICIIFLLHFSIDFQVTKKIPNRDAQNSDSHKKNPRRMIEKRNWILMDFRMWMLFTLDVLGELLLLLSILCFDVELNVRNNFSLFNF